jgi:hypothetical protein
MTGKASTKGTKKLLADIDNFDLDKYEAERQAKADRGEFDDWTHYFEYSGKVQFDMNGHYGLKKNESIEPNHFKHLRFDLRMSLSSLRFLATMPKKAVDEGHLDDLKIIAKLDSKAEAEETWAKLNECIKTGKPIDTIVKMHATGSDCNVCGERLQWATDGQKVFVQNKCKYPGGMPAYSFEIDVPSGKLAFTNDLREQYPVCDDFYINHDTEIRRCSKEYAKIGLFHFFVGNSCPSINKVSDTEIVLGRDGCSDDREVWISKTDKTVKLSKEEYKKAKLPGRRVGSICTDLWWFSAADYNDLKGRLKGEELKELDEKNKWAGFTVVKLKPGRYRCTYNYRKWQKLEDSNPVAAAKQPHDYAIIKRIGDVKSKNPPKVKEWPILSLEDAIRVGCLAWPTLHPTRERMLDYMYCTIGGSYDWTPNGQIRAGGRKEIDALKRIKGVVVPSEKLTSYYPLSNYSNVCNVPDNVRPDYLAGAFEVLDNIINHSDVNDNSDQDGGKRNAENIKEAKKVREELQKRFSR